MKKINKYYAEIMLQADSAVGRKEVVSLLKKAATIMSKSEENLASWIEKIYFFRINKTIQRIIDEEASIKPIGNIIQRLNHIKFLIFFKILPLTGIVHKRLK